MAKIINKLNKKTLNWYRKLFKKSFKELKVQLLSGLEGLEKEGK